MGDFTPRHVEELDGSVENRVMYRVFLSLLASYIAVISATKDVKPKPKAVISCLGLLHGHIVIYEDR